MRRTESELSGIVTSAARVNVTYWVEEMLEPCGSLRDIWIGFSERLIASRDKPKGALRSTSTTAEVTGNNEARTHFAQAAYLRRKHVRTRVPQTKQYVNCTETQKFGRARLKIAGRNQKQFEWTYLQSPPPPPLLPMASAMP